MTTKHERWTLLPPLARDLNGREQTLWTQDRVVRRRAKHPLARWRMAVTAIVEPLVLAIVPLLIWGMLGRAATPLLLAIGLAIGLILLVAGTLLVSALAVDARAWQRDEAR